MTELKPFQIEGVKQIYQFQGRALLADEQGLGKTIQALYWIKKIPKRRPAIIVCPASLKYTWQSEASLHFGMRTEVLEGHRKKRVKDLPGDIVILNYDILKSWLPCLVRNNPAVVVFDEVHYCTNHNAVRTKAAIELASSASSVIGLSGTPLTSRPIQLWSILKIIRPDIYPSRIKYAFQFCQPRYTPWGWQYDGAQNLDLLRSTLLEECLIRRTKKQVLKDLPDKQRRVISFRLKSYKEYDKARHEFMDWLRALSPARAARAKNNQALTKVGYLLRLAAKLKLDITTLWIKEFFETHPNEKLVALTMNTFVIDHLAEKFKNNVIIDGRVTGKKRTESVRKFQTSARVNILLGNVKAAGVGLTLTAARHIVSLDLPWTPGDLLQGEDRVHRIGQKRDVIVYYLITRNTLEEKVMKVLQEKADILDAILNGEMSGEDLRMFDDLMSEILESEKRQR